MVVANDIVDLNLKQEDVVTVLDAISTMRSTIGTFEPERAAALDRLVPGLIALRDGLLADPEASVDLKFAESSLRLMRDILDRHAIVEPAKAVGIQTTRLKLG